MSISPKVKKMVLSAIARGVTIGKKIYQTSKRIDKKYKFVDPTNKFIRKYVPPQYRGKAYRFNKYLQIATTGGIIYDTVNQALEFSQDAFQKPISTNKQFQTRGRYFRRSYSSSRKRKSDMCRKCFRKKRSYSKSSRYRF